MNFTDKLFNTIAYIGLEKWIDEPQIPWCLECNALISEGCKCN